jgi:hypothetical protein
MRPQHSGVLPISLLLRIHAPAAFGRPAHQKTLVSGPERDALFHSFSSHFKK